MTIRTMVVDDEPLAREGIRVLLERDEDIDLVGSCGDGSRAVEEIRDLEPELLFLDIQMPELDGFEVLERLSADERPVVVFVTAYDEYALRAFEVHALDYLLKPYDDERFYRALRRAKSALRNQRDAAFAERLAALLEERRDLVADAENGGVERGREPAGERESDRFIVKSAGRIAFVGMKEVQWVEAAGDYVRLHTDDRSHLLRATMKEIQERLDAGEFVRIHRSTIVRLSQIREIRSDNGGSQAIVLRDGTRRSLSRTGKERLEERLGRAL